MAFRRDRFPTGFPTGTKLPEPLHIVGGPSLASLRRRVCTPRSSAVDGGAGNFFYYSDLSDSPTLKEEIRGSGESDASRLVGCNGCPATYDWARDDCSPRAPVVKNLTAYPRPARWNTGATQSHGAPRSCVFETASRLRPAPAERRFLWAPRSPSQTDGYRSRLSERSKAEVCRSLLGEPPGPHLPRTV